MMELIPDPINEPHGGDWVIFSDACGQQLSVAVTGTQGTVQLVTVMVAGQVTTGPVLSSPTTWTVQWFELPQRSVTVTVTTAVFPEKFVVPAGGDCEYTNEQSGVQLSVALT